MYVGCKEVLTMMHCYRIQEKVSRSSTGSKIGTSSIRRRAQILKLRKDLSVSLLRGNIDTRIKQLHAKSMTLLF